MRTPHLGKRLAALMLSDAIQRTIRLANHGVKWQSSRISKILEFGSDVFEKNFCCHSTKSVEGEQGFGVLLIVTM